MEATFEKMFTVYGGQFGSEGKGQIVRYITGELVNKGRVYAYRIGGPNAGHTFYIGEDKIVTCQIPGPMFLAPSVVGIIGPEGVISPGMLARELQDLVQHRQRTNGGRGFQTLLIDQSAAIITDEQLAREASLVKNIGSTGKGVGAATADKVMRTGKTAKDYDFKTITDKYDLFIDIKIVDTIGWVQKQKNKGPAYAIVEGTQGAGLSLHTSGYYPHCTSRECTPQGIWAGCGLHPGMAKESESVMVIRTYPIRVAGPSGPMTNELTWEEVSRRVGREVKEITTVTKNTRRVSEIDIPELERTIAYTRPDAIALTFLDYVNSDIYKKDPRGNTLSQMYVSSIEQLLDTPVKYVGTGEGYVYQWRV
jgi:adenylosuccinate synthase